MSQKFACVYIISHVTKPNINYIGSTNNFSRRYSSHKHCIKFNYNTELYNTIREHGIENFNFQILKDCSDMNINDIRKLEQETIDLLEPSLNKIKAYNPIDLKEQKRINSQKFRDKNPTYMRDYGIKQRKLEIMKRNGEVIQ